MTKRTITIQAFLAPDINHEYKGRLLGLLTEDEYAGLISKEGLLRRLSSVATKPLEELANLKVDVEGLRLVMTVTEKDGAEVLTPYLFVTTPLDIISSIMSNCINLNGEKDTFYILEEEVDK